MDETVVKISSPINITYITLNHYEWSDVNISLSININHYIWIDIKISLSINITYIIVDDYVCNWYQYIITYKYNIVIVDHYVWN